MQEQTPATTLRQMIMGFRVTQLIYVAAQLGIADLLHSGTQDVASLAHQVGSEPRALYRLLRALASLGIFAELEDGRFQLTPLAQGLRRDTPGSLHGLALLYGDDWLWQAYGQMLYSVQTGLPAFQQLYGQKFFDYLDQQPAARATFQQAMSANSGQEAAALLDAYDFTSVTKLIDIGGGQGALLNAILSTYPTMSGVLFDLPSVITAGETVAARGERVAGDFFQAVPTEGDLYLLKSVLHDWDDTQSLAILKNCRRAMPPQGRLLVVERVLPAGNAAAEAKLFDINMLVVLGGQERTVTEFQALFQAAGFQLTRVIATASPLSLIEGIPAAHG